MSSNLNNKYQTASFICVGYVQKVLKPFFENFEISANSETLWTTVLEKLIISLKFSIEVFI
jgi:hypothetical protein